MALFARAVVDGDREAAERNRVRAEARVRYELGRDSSFERAATPCDLAYALFAVGEYPESVATAQRSLRETPVEGTVLVVGLSLRGSGEIGRGVTLFAAARRQAREDGIADDVVLEPVLERIENQARAELGEDAYEAAVRAGEALTRDEAAELALSSEDDRRRLTPETRYDKALGQRLLRWLSAATRGARTPTDHGSDESVARLA